MSRGATIVVDLGKTLSKVSLWDADGQMLDRHVRANQLVAEHGIRRLDIDGIADWLVQALSLFRSHAVERIIPVGHGAGVVALVDGAPAFPPVDYEQSIPTAVMANYRLQRDPFDVTGSPALPDGLNLGAQLHWLETLYPEQMARSTFVPWAQYWAWFLSGRAVSEPTSLGCHSDLWLPQAGHFSPLAHRRGWSEQFAPVVAARDVIGHLTPQLAAKTGLSAEIEILAGLHDSNAALMAARGFSEIAENEATVLSTGTWFIAMNLSRTPLSAAQLPQARDCLVNVDAFARPVPSARFMGGREIEALIELDTRRVDIKPDQPALLAAIPKVLATEAMILPTLAPGCGPFPHNRFKFRNRPDDWFSRRAAACLYAALMTTTTLDLIGSQEQVLVEGRFAEADVFVRALASLRPDCAIYTANAHNDVSFGALRLARPDLSPAGTLQRVEPLESDLTAYKHSWLAAVAQALEETAA